MSHSAGILHSVALLAHSAGFDGRDPVAVRSVGASCQEPGIVIQESDLFWGKRHRLGEVCRSLAKVCLWAEHLRVMSLGLVAKAQGLHDASCVIAGLAGHLQ